MPNKWGLPVEVLMDVEAPAEEIQAVKAAFSDAGVEATVEAGLETRSVDLAPWVISFSVPVGIFLKSFLEAAGKSAVKSAGEAAGKDAYAGVKQLCTGLYEARRPARRRGSVVIIDTVSHQRVLLADDLPDLAFQRLFETDIARTESGTLCWDPKTESWRDVWDIDRLTPSTKPEIR